MTSYDGIPAETRFRILVVDDNVDLCTDLQDILELVGYPVESAYNGADALALSRQKNYDLVLVDIELPDMTGQEVVEKISAHAPSTEFIYITGYASLENAMEAVRQKSVVSYETKPLDMDRLQTIIGQIYQRKQAEKALQDSRKQYYNLVQEIHDGIFEVDAEGVFTFANQPLAQIHGFEHPDALIGHHLTEFVAPAMRDEIRQWFRADTGIEPEMINIEIIRPDGTNAVVETKAVFVMKEGRVLRIRGVVRDITGRRQAEERLEKEPAAVTAILNNILLGEEDETEKRILDTCLVATNSVYGYIGVVNAQGRFDTTTYAGQALRDCAFPEFPARDLTTDMTIRGIFTWPMVHGEALLCNDLPTHPDRVGFPEGHIPLHCFLGVPLKGDGEVVGMISVANKPGGYTEADKNILLRLASVVSLSRLVTTQTQELRDALARLQEISDRLGLATRAAEIGIWDWDVQNNVLLWDDSMRALYGIKREDFHGTYEAWRDALLPQDMERTDAESQAALRGEKDYDTEFRIVRPDGAVRHIRSIAAVYRDEYGEPVRMIGVNWDITEHKEVEEELIRSREAADAANRTKSEFLANMSHEIRTPMNAILGFTEILGDLVTGTLQQGYLSSIQASGRSLLTLINDILDLSKVEAGKLDLEWAATDPSRVFEEMEQIFSMKMAEKRLTWQVEIDPGMPSALILDEVRLRQILVNLVSNAVKFTDEGHIKLVVSNLYPDRNRSKLDLAFSVEDTGIGIPEDQLASIFSPFEQKTGQNTARYGGAGLGLAIVKRLVDIMSGEISVTSQVGKGSTFSVTLKGVMIAATTDLETQTQADIDIDAVAFEHASILIVDDDAVNRELIKAYLEDYDLNLLEAEDGEEAIEQVRQHQPDLVVMDLRMPGMDGVEAAQRIKADETLRTIPIIALTASGMTQQSDAFQTLCEGYLRKPVQKAVLVTEMMRFLKHTMVETPASDVEIPSEAVEAWSPDMLDVDTLARLPELVERLEAEKDRWERLGKALIIDEVNAFAGRIRELGAAYGYPPLAAWGAQLEQQARMFDMDAIPRTLAGFPEVVERIQIMTRGE